MSPGACCVTDTNVWIDLRVGNLLINVFELGVPITLVDGERLLDLLIEHEIGLQKNPAVLYEVSERYFDDEQ